MTTSPGSRREFRLPGRSRRRVVNDVNDELAFHLARRTEELIAKGLSPDEARRQAESAFGDLDFTRRYCRDEDIRRERGARHTMMLDELGKDLAYALRSLRSAPGFATVTLLTLALGIGANTAIFSVVRGVLLEPLPYANADRLVRLWHANPSESETHSVVSEPDYLDWRAANRSFSSMGAYFYQPGGGSGVDFTGTGAPEHLEATLITPGFFQTLGVSAVLGRTIRDEEAVVGNDRYIVLSHGFWQRRFGGDPSIIGRALTLDGMPFTVLGVMPPEFAYPSDRVELWVPLSVWGEESIGRARQARFLDVIARLRADVSMNQADQDLDAIAGRIAERETAARGWSGVTLEPVRDAMFGEVRRPLIVLVGAVGFVLLITCVNIASLLLARASARQSELAVRSALGAGRGRIVRQLLTESLVLALIGGALGVVLAMVAVRAFATMGAAELPRASEIRIDGLVLLFAFLVSMIAGLLFGLLPAVRATSQNLQSVLRAGARGSVGGTGQRLRSALVVAEVALAVVLVIGAGLALKSVTRLLDVDPGFRAENVLTARVGLSDAAGEREVYYTTLFERLGAIPGVEAVGAAKNLPLRGTGESWQGFAIPARGDREARTDLRFPVLHVSADYFEAMRIPVKEGRVFTPEDREDAPEVFVVNEAFARRYFQGESAVGQMVQLGQGEFAIIGVVGDVRQASLSEAPEPTVYIHYLQNQRSGLGLAIRTSGDPLSYANVVRETIWSVYRDQTITNMETMSSIVGTATARPRLLAMLLALFGLMGLALGALGIYGVLAYAVSQRRQEIGVRVALGATPGSVFGIIVRHGMLLAAIGVVAGVAGAVVLTRIMTAVLYEVRPTDPATFTAVVVVLLATAFLASWIPARRALRIDPVQALRYE